MDMNTRWFAFQQDRKELIDFSKDFSKDPNHKTKETKEVKEIEVMSRIIAYWEKELAQCHAQMVANAEKIKWIQDWLNLETEQQNEQDNQRHTVPNQLQRERWIMEMDMISIFERHNRELLAHSYSIQDKIHELKRIPECYHQMHLLESATKQCAQLKAQCRTIQQDVKQPLSTLLDNAKTMTEECQDILTLQEKTDFVAAVRRQSQQVEDQLTHLKDTVDNMYYHLTHI